ncbi:hypothetical protein IHE45_04G150700 [Dioscorea alata]|uniref:Uncharacterized protein n=1 Tax=Dioscorea alata TaxID=55571 RepID=A0ACB7WH83_DIOAL|nr:hypothetical protein IHE45_04G150700 [Dioscorea alata]
MSCFLLRGSEICRWRIFMVFSFKHCKLYICGCFLYPCTLSRCLCHLLFNCNVYIAIFLLLNKKTYNRTR